MINAIRFTGIVVSAVMVLSHPLTAATVTIVATADTGIMQDTPNNNMGSNTTVAAGGLAGNLGNVGPTRALYKFNIASQIPVDSTVQSASVSMRVTKTPLGTTVASSFGLHKMLVDWAEGNKGANQSTGQGGFASSGEPTWNARAHPSTLWGTPGGQAGVDRAATASSSVLMNNVGTYIFPNTAALTADVQAWANNPQANFGWMLISQSENIARTARRFGTRHSPINDRPVLTVTFEPPPLRLVNVTLGASDFRFNFNALQGRTYTVQRSTNLNDPAGWVTFSNVGPVIINPNPLISDPRASSPRFYRVFHN